VFAYALFGSGGDASKGVDRFVVALRVKAYCCVSLGRSPVADDHKCIKS
jgi:hypothetical protein